MNHIPAALAGALLGIGLASATAPVSAQVIYRCMVDGQPVYQQDACQSGSARSERLQADKLGELVPVAPEPPRPVRPAASAVPAPVAEAPSAPAPRPEARPRATALRTKPTTPSQLLAEADACLEWYRPMLREPQAAYRTAPRKEGAELIVMIHSPNGQGGFQTQVASCEFGEAGLDTAATQVHALRRGWKSLAQR